MASTFALPPPRTPLARAEQHKPLLVALVCSGAVHAVLAIVIAAAVALAPRVEEPVAARPVLRAMLQPGESGLEPFVLPSSREHLPAPSLPAPLAPLALPDVTANVQPQPSARGSGIGARTDSARTLDPNGAVTVGSLSEPAHMSRTVAAAVTDRYRTVRPDRLPRLTAALLVPYPAEARSGRTSARIAAVLDIDERGRITSTSLVPNDPTFAPAVMEALRDARFTPAEVATHPVPYWAVLEFDFAIAPR